MNAVNITPETLFQRWLAAPYRPLLCEFEPSVTEPVKRVVIGTIGHEPVYAYGALGRQFCAYWWEHWSLDREEALDCAWQYLTQEIKKAYKRLEKIRTFLTEYLCLCPLCRSPYDKSDDILNKLQLNGFVQITCRCPESDSGTNELVKEIFEFGKSKISSVSPPPNWYEVAEASIGGVVVARLSFERFLGRITLSFSQKVFKGVHGKPDSAFVWPHTKRAILTRQEDDCRGRADRGELLKLNLGWNPQRETWTASSPMYPNVTCFVRSRYAVSSGGWYYCRITQKEDGSNQWMQPVEPIYPIPVRHQPRSAFRPVRR